MLLDCGVSLPVQAVNSSTEQQSENKAGRRKGSMGKTLSSFLLAYREACGWGCGVAARSADKFAI